MAERAPTLPKHVLLLRHGSTEQGSNGLFTGRLDVPLSKKGEEQARAWTPVFDKYPNATAFTSPLVRATETARLAGLSDPVVAGTLAEWDLGSLEGVDADRYRSERPGWSIFTRGIDDGSGESIPDIEVRTARTWAMLRERGGDLVVVVSHGQYLRALITRVVGLPLSAATSFSLGPARAALASLRAGGSYSLTGWNISPMPLECGLLADLT